MIAMYRTVWEIRIEKRMSKKESQPVFMLDDDRPDENENEDESA